MKTQAFLADKNVRAPVQGRIVQWFGRGLWSLEIGHL
jgi:hypothetical protein